MAMTCPKCGAENTDEARFCRICGVQVGADGFHEAPTRNFEQRQVSSSQPPSQPEVSPFATYGADGSAILPPRDPRMYVPPSVVQQPGTMMGYQHGTSPAGPIPTNPLQTGPVRKSRVGRVLAVVAGIFALILACLIGLGIWVASNIKVNREPVLAGPTVAEKVRPAPASPAVSMDDWVYDGATVDIRSEGSGFGMEGGLLQMTTEDDVETVGDFYRDLLTDAAQKQEIRQPDKLVFISDGTVVVVEPSEDTEGMTSIKVVFGNMAGIPGMNGGKPGKIPPIPPVTVDAPPAAPPAPPATDGKTGPDAKAPKAEAAPPAKPAKP